MATSACRNCPLLQVARRKLGTDENSWEITELSLESFLKQDTNDSTVHKLTAFASARDVDDVSQKRSRCLSYGGLVGAGVQMAILAAKTLLMSIGILMAIVILPCSVSVPDSADGLLDTWFRFLIKQTFDDVPKGQKDYLWYKFNIFTRWIPSTRQSIVLVFDPRPAVRERLPSPLLDSSDFDDASDPYWIHAVFAEEVIRLQDDAVWSVRNLVRKTEIQRTTSTAPNPDYPRLHDIARHAIHVSETLDLAAKTVDCMMTQHDQFLADKPTLDDRTKTAQTKIRRRLHFYNDMLSSLRSRSASNKERLLNEIQLAFNTVAQYDSRIGVEIGRAAQVDSSAMKTIAFLTLTFFPATFISAVFSMSFFNYDPESEQWSVSSKIWVYWVVAIPVTCITALLWLFWHKIAPPKPIGEEDLQRRPRGRQLVKEELKAIGMKLGAKDEEGNVEGIMMRS